MLDSADRSVSNAVFGWESWTLDLDSGFWILLNSVSPTLLWVGVLDPGLGFWILDSAELSESNTVFGWPAAHTGR